MEVLLVEVLVSEVLWTGRFIPVLVVCDGMWMYLVLTVAFNVVLLVCPRVIAVAAAASQSHEAIRMIKHALLGQFRTLNWPAKWNTCLYMSLV